MVIDFKQKQDRKFWDNLKRQGYEAMGQGKLDFMELTDQAIEALLSNLGLTGKEKDLLEQLQKDPINCLISCAQELYLRKYVFTAESKSEAKSNEEYEEQVRAACVILNKIPEGY